MQVVTVFVEGDPVLRPALGRLFEGAIAGKKLDFRPLGDTDSAIKGFRSARDGKHPFVRPEQAYLLIDLEGPEAQREPVLAKKQLASERHRVFFMVQQMEAWFLAHPAEVRAYFGIGTGTLPGGPPQNVVNPTNELDQAAKARAKHKHKRGRSDGYHKTHDAPELLRRLNVTILRNTFKDVDLLLSI